jgi:signal transduction histidine kinase
MTTEVDFVPAVTFMLDLEGVCTLSEGSGLAALGWTGGELVGRNLLEVFADSPGTLAHLYRVLAGESFEARTELRGHRLQTHYRPVLGDDGRVAAGLGVTVDATGLQTLLAQRQTARERADGLAEVSAALAGDTADVRAGLAVVARTAARLLRAAATVQVLDGGDHEAVIASSAAPDGSWSEPFALDAARLRSVAAAPVDGVLEAPLGTAGDLVGLLTVHRGADPDDTTRAEDEQLLADLAQRCALAVTNARLAALAEQFTALARSSANLVGAVGPDGRLGFLNPAGRGLVGLADDDPLDLPKAQHLVQVLSVRGLPVAQAGREWEGLLHLPGPDGPLPLLSAVFPLTHPSTGRSLGYGVIGRDVSPQVRSEREFAGVARQREDLLRRLLVAQEEERTRIAGDIHDDTVQTLAALDLRLGLLRQQLVRAGVPELGQALDDVATAVQRGSQHLRTLMFDLDGPARSRPLVEAVEQSTAHRLGPLGLSWSVRAAEQSEPWTLGRADDATGTRRRPRPGEAGDPEIARVSTYRIVQEAVSNIARHSGAATVEVVVSETTAGLRLLVRDDGHGFSTQALDEDPAPAQRRHRGLAAMRERAEAAGGQLTVTSSPRGTDLEVWIPLSPRG